MNQIPIMAYLGYHERSTIYHIEEKEGDIKNTCFS